MNSFKEKLQSFLANKKAVTATIIAVVIVIILIIIAVGSCARDKKDEATNTDAVKTETTTKKVVTKETTAKETTTVAETTTIAETTTVQETTVEEATTAATAHNSYSKTETYETDGYSASTSEIVPELPTEITTEAPTTEPQVPTEAATKPMSTVAPDEPSPAFSSPYYLSIADSYYKWRQELANIPPYTVFSINGLNSYQTNMIVTIEARNEVKRIQSIIDENERVVSLDNADDNTKALYQLYENSNQNGVWSHIACGFDGTQYDLFSCN